MTLHIDSLFDTFTQPGTNVELRLTVPQYMNVVVVDGKICIIMQHQPCRLGTMLISMGRPNYLESPIAIDDSIIVRLQHKSVWRVAMTVGPSCPQWSVTFINDQIAITLHLQSILATGEELILMQCCFTISKPGQHV